MANCKQIELLKDDLESLERSFSRMSKNDKLDELKNLKKRVLKLITSEDLCSDCKKEIIKTYSSYSFSLN